MIVNKKTLLLFIAFTGTLNALAQKETDLRKSFPAAEAVYTNLLCEVNIAVTKGKITSSSQYSEDLMYLTDNAVKMMSRGRIYHSSFNELKNWDAYTLAQNKKLKVANTTTASSTQDYIFYDDAKATSFDFTGGVAGASRHMAYQLQNNDVHLLSPHYFDRYFPVSNGELRVTFPQNVKIKYLIKGVQAEKVQFTEIKKRDKTTYSFKVENFTGMPNYPDAPDDSYYATHVIFYIEQVEEAGQWKNFLSSPTDLYRFNYGFIKNLNQTVSKELQETTDGIIKNATTNKEKAAAIYRWVQKNIKYVAFEDGLEGFIPREANLVFNRKFGDCKDMASILTAMLTHAKIPAYITWIGTRDLPYDYTETPLPIVDNHMICAVKIDEEFIFLDGTDDGCIFGQSPSSLQNKQAMIAINEQEYKIVRLPEIPKEKNRLTDSTFLEIEGKDLKGRIKIQMTGYLASSFYSITNYRTAKENEDYLKQRFQRGNNKIKFSNWQYTISDDHTTAVIMADVSLPDYARFLGDEIYMNLNLFKWYEHQEIDFPKRQSPIERPYLDQSSYTTILKLPAEFNVSYLPKSQTYTNDIWGFGMNYQQSTTAVALTQTFETAQLMLYPKQFELWNNVLENLFPHYKQTITLTKN